MLAINGMNSMGYVILADDFSHFIAGVIIPLRMKLSKAIL